MYPPYFLTFTNMVGLEVSDLTFLNPPMITVQTCSCDTVRMHHLNITPTPGNFYVNLPPLFLGHFSPIFSSFFPVFFRLAPKIQETGTKTRKNCP